MDDCEEMARDEMKTMMLMFPSQSDADADLVDYPFLYEAKANAVTQQNTTQKTDLNENNNTTGT